MDTDETTLASAKSAILNRISAIANAALGRDWDHRDGESVVALASAYVMLDDNQNNKGTPIN